ncbi:Crp/Fnr family transcriptional regulator [Gloeobacter violaceus]|uniref:Gll3853 protein n=1 Tax=Gloeobacter violaceus (strain ATCC 29082 / PCC 7421) TaxID=251221 RepID=Q7NEM6_GLOVI|nr:Crp/Fnr family transcriptional regulator [Gloeobacter violaceus]BAC91794.1 gll3853 [Gloeobacter violaceus PCC 7421]
MQVTVEQLAAVSVFAALTQKELGQLCSHARVHIYRSGEIVIHEGDPLPAALHALLEGSLRITRTAATGKETIFRALGAGEIFAAPALFGDGIAPATVTAAGDCRVLLIEREALLAAVRQTPEITLRLLAVFNQRLQQLHDIVHGLVSERAIVRLARFVQYAASRHGTEMVDGRQQLKSRLSYYQIARSIGITYEECVRLFKQLKPALAYGRGGQIAVLDAGLLEVIASGDEENPKR